MDTAVPDALQTRSINDTLAGVDNVQVAPQEVEVSSYLVGRVLTRKWTPTI
ncbi:hypothetical protein ACLB1M_18020 [Escherichia coli]